MNFKEKFVVDLNHQQKNTLKNQKLSIFNAKTEHLLLKCKACNKNKAHPHANLCHQIAFSVLTISMAVMADSKPLLPAFVPARSMVCSMFSVVKIPLITGMS